MSVAAQAKPARPATTSERVLLATTIANVNGLVDEALEFLGHACAAFTYTHGAAIDEEIAPSETDREEFTTAAGRIVSALRCIPRELAALEGTAEPRRGKRTKSDEEADVPDSSRRPAVASDVASPERRKPTENEERIDQLIETATVMQERLAELTRSLALAEVVPSVERREEHHRSMRGSALSLFEKTVEIKSIASEMMYASASPQPDAP